VISSSNPFLINIGFLINQPIGYSRELPFDFDEIVLGGDLRLQDFHGSLTLNRTQDGLRARALFESRAQSECGRCLVLFLYSIQTEFEEFFTFPYVQPSEQEIKIPENGNIDFEPILYEHIQVGFPINPVCRENCRGLCSICGYNLNDGGCEHDLKKVQEKSIPEKTTT